MPTASCQCGKCKIKISKIISTGICHCTLCRKMAGSLFSLNAIVPAEDFTIERGSPKVACMGLEVTTKSIFYIRGDCGSNLWNESTEMPGLKVLKAGMLDRLEEFEQLKPKVEQFAARRPTWLKSVTGVTQIDGMQEGVEQALVKKRERPKM